MKKWISVVLSAGLLLGSLSSIGTEKVSAATTAPPELRSDQEKYLMYNGEPLTSITQRYYNKNQNMYTRTADGAHLIYDIATGNYEAVAFPPTGVPVTVSPDSRLALIQTNTSGDVYSNVLHDLTTGTSRVLSYTSTMHGAVFTPDSNFAYFVSGHGGYSTALHRLDVATGITTLVYTPDSFAGRIYQFHLSDDGRITMYQDNSSSNQNRLVTIKDGTTTVLHLSTSNVIGNKAAGTIKILGDTPDKSGVVIAKYNTDDMHRVWSVNYSTKAVAAYGPVIRHAAYDNFYMSPNGERLLLEDGMINFLYNPITGESESSGLDAYWNRPVLSDSHFINTISMKDNTYYTYVYKYDGVETYTGSANLDAAANFSSYGMEVGFNLMAGASEYVLTRNGTVIQTIVNGTAKNPAYYFNDTNSRFVVRDQTAIAGTEYTYRLVVKRDDVVISDETVTSGFIPSEVAIGNVTAKVGDLVLLGGKYWYVLDENSLLLRDSANTRNFGTGGSGGRYNSTDASGVGYYLNTTLYNEYFTTDEKTYLKRMTLPVNSYTFKGASMPTNPVTQSVENVFVALPSAEQIAKSPIANLNNGFTNYWVLSYIPSSATSAYHYTVSTKSFTTASSTDTKQVRAMVTLKPNVIVTGSGTLLEPFEIGGLGPEPLPTITGLATSDITSSQIYLTWNAVTGATSYEIRRNGILVTTIPSTTYLDTGLLADTNYTYTVTARSSNSQSPVATTSAKTLQITVGDPTNFRTTNVTATSAALAWDGSSNAVSYEVTRNGAVVYSGATTHFTDPSLDPETAYNYSLRALNGSAFSNPVTLQVTTLEDIVLAPTNFVAGTTTHNTIPLSWNNGSTDVELYRAGELIYTGTDSQYTDIGREMSTSYSYELRSVRGGKFSEYVTLSATTAGPNPELRPGVGETSPTRFEALDVALTSADLSWDTIANADEYIVRKGSEQIYKGTDTEFALTGLEQETDYTLSLVGVNAHGESTARMVSFKTLGEIPADPTNFKANRIYSNQVALQWSRSENAKSYEVVRDGDVVVYTGPLTTFLDTTLASETTYEYTVRAINDYGSSQTTVLTVTTVAESPAIVIQIPTTPPLQGTITFDFKVVEGAVSYYVDRNPEWKYELNGDGTFAWSSLNTITGVYDDLGTVTPNANGMLPFQEAGLNPSQNYHYNITAVRLNGQGEEEVIGTTPVDAEAGPSPTPTPTPTPTPGGNAGGGNGGGAVVPTPAPTTNPSPTPTAPTTPKPTSPSKPSVKFPDVSGHWAADAISDLYDRDIVKGETDGMFYPDRNITRAEFTTMVVKSFIEIDHDTQRIYSDVGQSKWYYDYVNSGTLLGIVKGIGHNKFAPDAHVTRQEMSSIVSRVLISLNTDFDIPGRDIENVLGRFEDNVSIHWWARHGSAVLVKHNVINGTSKGIFNPLKTGTRAEAATMISKTIKMIKDDK